MDLAREEQEELDLSIVILNWNVRELLDACINSVKASLQRDPALTAEIIVVDAGSSDRSVEMVAELHPDVELLALGENVGFSRGNNVGLARSRGRYLLVLNPDTETLSDALPAMVSHLRAHPDVGVLGPKLLNPDGSVQSSRRRFPSLGMALAESPVLQEWFPNSRALQRYTIRDRSDDIEQDVDWVYGACFLVRRQVYLQVGGLDESFFMYSEELDWMKRIRDQGWRVIFWPGAEVIHHGGQSSAQVVAQTHIVYQSSKVHYFRKHRGPVPSAILRAFTLASYGVLMALEGAKWLLGHKRPLRASRVATYRQVIASGLRSATGLRVASKVSKSGRDL